VRTVSQSVQRASIVRSPRGSLRSASVRWCQLFGTVAALRPKRMSCLVQREEEQECRRGATWRTAPPRAHAATTKAVMASSFNALGDSKTAAAAPARRSSRLLAGRGAHQSLVTPPLLLLLFAAAASPCYIRSCQRQLGRMFLVGKRPAEGAAEAIRQVRLRAQACDASVSAVFRRLGCVERELVVAAAAASDPRWPQLK